MEPALNELNRLIFDRQIPTIVLSEATTAVAESRVRRSSVLGRHVKAYSKRRVAKAFIAFEEGYDELADVLLKQHLKENRITPWAWMIIKLYTRKKNI